MVVLYHLYICSNLPAGEAMDGTIDEDIFKVRLSGLSSYSTTTVQ